MLESPINTRSLADGGIALEAAVRAIHQAIEAGDLVQARSAIACLMPTINAPLRPRVLVLLARTYRIEGEVLTCLGVAADAANAAQTHGDTTSEVDANLEAGHALEAADDRVRALSFFEAAEKLSKRMNSPSVEARVLQAFGIAAAHLDRHAQAIAYLERSVAMLKSLDQPYDWFSARLSLMCAHSQAVENTPMAPQARREQFRGLLGQWQALAEDAEAAGVTVIGMLARNNFATAQRHAGDFAAALENQVAALQRAEALKRRPSIAISHYEVGMSLLALGRFAEALAAFQRALTYFADGSKRGQSETYRGIALANEALGDFRAAYNALKDARDVEITLTDQTAHNAIARRELAGALQTSAARWERLAKEDSLTELPNRRAFEQWINAAMARVTAAQPLTVLLLDIDEFKVVNDTFGHAVGDSVLKKIAELLRLNCRYADFPTRHGGEEFILALPQTSKAIGIEVAERIRIAVSHADWHTLHAGLKLTVSIGVATAVGARPSGPGVAELLEAADQNLYAAKARGRNSVVA